MVSVGSASRSRSSVGGDRRSWWSSSRVRWLLMSSWSLLVTVRSGKQKTPAWQGSGVCRACAVYRDRTPSYTTCPARQRGDRYTRRRTRRGSLRTECRIDSADLQARVLRGENLARLSRLAARQPARRRVSASGSAWSASGRGGRGRWVGVGSGSARCPAGRTRRPSRGSSRPLPDAGRRIRVQLQLFVAVRSTK